MYQIVFFSTTIKINVFKFLKIIAVKITVKYFVAHILAKIIFNI